jgi:hypothetical protein
VNDTNSFVRLPELARLYERSPGRKAPNAEQDRHWLKKYRIFIEFENGDGLKAYSESVSVDGFDLSPNGEPHLDTAVLDMSLRDLLRHMNNRMHRGLPPLS